MINAPIPIQINAYAIELSLIDDESQALLLAWRNQIEIREAMVNQAVITAEQHANWYKKVREKSNELHFIIRYKDQAIGSINIKTEHEAVLHHAKQAEIGLYIAEPAFRNNIIAFSPALALIDYAFEALKIQCLSSKVRADNQPALKYNQQLGYQLSEPTNDLVAISLTKPQYQHASKQLKSLLNRGT